jgi:hypothetical protein
MYSEMQPGCVEPSSPRRRRDVCYAANGAIKGEPLIPFQALRKNP